VKGAGRWLAFPLALAFMVRIAGAGLLRLAEGLRMGPWWRRWGRWTPPRTEPATLTRARDDSIAYLLLMHEDRAARSQRRCLPTGSGFSVRCSVV